MSEPAIPYAHLIKRPHANPDPLLNTSEAAEYLGISPQTLCNWRTTRRYKIEAVKVGRLVRYRRSTLDAFIRARTEGLET